MADLPEFEGIEPVGSVNHLKSHKDPGERITRALRAGERVLLLVDARVDEIGHTKTDQGLVRVHKLKAEDVFEVDGDRGPELLAEHKERALAAEDERAGRVPLPFTVDDTDQGLTLVTDASGVVMTAAEVAEARGEAYSEAGVYTVVFAGGTRALWPDDWRGAGQSLAAPGGFMRLPGAEPGETDQVRQLLDVDSGAVVGEWSDEQEAERLAALESALEAEESVLAADDGEWWEAQRRAMSGLAADWEIVDGWPVPQRGVETTTLVHRGGRAWRGVMIGPGRSMVTGIYTDPEDETLKAFLSGGEPEDDVARVDGQAVRNCAVRMVKDAVAGSSDVGWLRRVWRDERQAKGRAGILNAAVARLAELENRDLDDVEDELAGMVA